MRQGTKFQCTNEECGCEITVSQASQAENADEQAFICVCGEEMEPSESAAPSASGRSGGRSGSRP
jgi:hypothetical protein